MIDFNNFFDIDEQVILNQCEFSSKEELIQYLKKIYSEYIEIYELIDNLIIKLDKLNFCDFNDLKKNIPFSVPYNILDN